MNFFKINDWRKQSHHPSKKAFEIFKYIGPGLLVTVGFIDPGNWATNFAGGAEYGYTLLWVITLSTFMLIVLQHNVAHLGIVTGLCLSEAVNYYLPAKVSKPVIISAVIASVSTSLAELLGAAIALQMLFGIPIMLGAILSAAIVIFFIFTNSYRKIERWIIAFVSIIGISFVYELSLVHIEWVKVAVNTFVPQVPTGSLVMIMSVLGAVVMPHNLFLHSEIIQSRQLHKQTDSSIRKLLKYEFFDTLFSMVAGWGINLAMFIMAAAIFFTHHEQISELQQAHQLLSPLLGKSASNIFAIALLFSGIASSVTSGMAGGSIFTGLFAEPFDIKDNHSRLGVLISIVGAVLLLTLVTNPLNALILSQMILSIQLPITILAQFYLTSSSKVMGKYANKKQTMILIGIIAAIVIGLNVWLLITSI
ncbi:Nramp family divalent metal transporter [Microbacter margulisiae]|uniref:Manganese transport protein n=1 Tax=Microbacter margulisiae TaxID=1350067 RepID=A0A7W5DNA8_9PORP|nr:Nramp family divalent metal transporter [Microbacter margulisiae]MBB3186087.1 manganese transport protein [Microbacter margulisiae]